MITHPAAELFPLLNDIELKELAEDIKKHGLLEPIVTYEGMLLDGRNRLRACELAGVKPMFIALDEERESPVNYVASKNLYRRQLTPAQRASIAFELSQLLRKETEHEVHPSAEGRTSQEGHRSKKSQEIEIAAKAMNVSASSVERVRAIKKRDINTFNAIKAGSMSIEEGLKKTGLKPSYKSKPRLPKIGSPEWCEAVLNFLGTLRAEIIRRRKENKDQRNKSNWNPDQVIKRFQSDLLDWIEQELDAGGELITGQPSK